jgi:hypothetical protein
MIFRVRMNDLQPDTYYYTVSSTQADGTLTVTSGVQQFNTRPAKADDCGNRANCRDRARSHVIAILVSATYELVNSSTTLKRALDSLYGPRFLF